MTAYYNEHDPFAAAWLRELITDGLIAPGDVDQRDIQEVTPDDVRAYTQCHFFAGIGGWSYALRLAGWPDDRPVWTGSCPCQPFSSAGKQEGHADPRHLWPEWVRLIRECRPATVFGEQVAAAIGWGWLDLVSADLEGCGYAVGAAVLPAAGVGAPHKRDRLWFVGHREPGREQEDAARPVGAAGPARGVADPEHDQQGPGRGLRGEDQARIESREGDGAAGAGPHAQPRRCGDVGGLADAERWAAERHGPELGEEASGVPERERIRDDVGDGRNPWADLLWLPCRDGKARPTQPGLQPLAHGVRNRVGTLRGSGNAIVPQVAAAFIHAYLER